MSDTKRAPHVVIAGAGITGITAAIALKRNLNYDNFTIYERAEAIGGTWRDNTYPGCGSDIPGHWYSLSTDLNPYWKSYYLSQPEIRAYWEDLWHKYGLRRHTVLNTSVVECVWSDEDQQYTVTIENSKSKESKRVVAEVVFFGIGPFQLPYYPKDVSGLENFKGELFHSARWRHDVALKGKRVGVIGNGCSAAQVVPEISKDTSTEVINFCRTPQWFVSSDNYSYSSTLQWIFAHIPFVMRLHRNVIMLTHDISSVILRKTNKRIVSFAKRRMERYMKSKAPKEYHERLIPSYPPGCKRIVVDAGYLDCLHRPNVNLKWDAIESVVTDGIKLKTGEVIPLDVIIFSTGYSLEPAELRVTGSQGNKIREYFESKGGPMAYLGTCIPGFPNLFFAPGPNVVSGTTSLIFSTEVQINFALQLIQPVLERKAKSFEVSHKATDEYNEWLQNGLKWSVWTECASYYHNARDKSSRIVATFPGPITLFWWLCRRPKWELFHGVDAEVFHKERERRRWYSLAAVTALLAWFLIL